MKKYCIIGGDNRTSALRSMYINNGSEITDIDVADVVIAPIPFSRDGKKINGEIMECDKLIDMISGSSKRLYTGAISDDIRKKLLEKNIEFVDLMEDEGIAILNSIPTAEGAIATAMEITDFTLHGAKVLVMGYGKIGKTLSKMLHGIGAKVYVEARNKKDIATIEAFGYNAVNLDELDNFLPNMDVIFNTIPCLILNKTRLQKIDKNCLIVDLASNPGGVDFNAAKKLNLDVVWALSLPSKVAPYTSAQYLKNTIDEIEAKIN